MSILERVGAPKPANDAPRPPKKTNGDGNGHFERARKWVAKAEPAISGSGGHDSSWAVARKCAQDFGLDYQQTLDILHEYNQRCQPPWSERELDHKAKSACEKARVSIPVEDREIHWSMPSEHYAAREAMPIPDDETIPETRCDSAGEPAPGIPVKRARTIVDVVNDWRNEGKLIRIPTGIPALDDACGGGLPLPRRVLIIGAPSAGKTFYEIVLADMFAARYSAMGFCVGIMAVDECDLDIGGRLAQIHGFSRDEIESRNPEILDAIARKLGLAKIRFYDSDWTVEDAVSDLVDWAKPDNTPMILCVDSLHTVRSQGSDLARNRKEFVDANCAALKFANIEHRITIIATGEMARGQYANEKFAEESVAIAACADSRGPEFMAEVLMKLTTPKGIDDVVCVELAKNRGGQRNVKFWLRMNFNQHTLTSTGDPNDDPVVVQQRETEKHDKADHKQIQFAEKLAAFILKHPHLPKRQLIGLAKVELHCGYAAIENGLTVLTTAKTQYRLVETKDGTGKTATTCIDVQRTPHEERHCND